MNSVRLITKNQSCKCRQIYSTCRRCLDNVGETSDEKTTEKKKAEESSSMDELTEPTNCCMSGCMNCVWIQYAEKLSAKLERSDVNLQNAIMEKVQDPNMRAFLSMELRCRNLLKD
ncbi:oxidoreductase-like domain-containing protein 1 [Lasioglossum baleicum]|uniref:oxidoreductase-like domain-containing protein 1 n=1 Tax=Lasioglossum baleicum TaxID=434251 RepID=UPI003FCD5C3B